MKKYLIFLFLILNIGFVLADTIENTNIHIKIYNNTLEIINSAYSGNNKNITINTTSINITNGTVGIISFQEFDFPILFIKNESVDKSTVDKYIECLSAKGSCDTEKSQFNMGWNNCRKDLDTCNSNNNQSIKDQLSSCGLEKQRIQMDLESKTTQINACNEDVKSNSNSKFIWAAGGGILVFVITMFVTGKWGNQNRDKSPEEFNPQRGY